MEVIGVDEDVDSLLDALSSDTARAVLNAIYEEPGTPSEIADRLDMSIQKISYHLEKLEDEDLIAVAGTRYSEKGQEMTVYEPPEDPLVLFVGTRERKDSLKALVKRLLPTIGILALASLAVQRFLGRDGGSGAVSLSTGAGGQAGGESGGGGADSAGAQDATPSATEAATETAADSGGDVTIQGGEPSATPTEVATETPMSTESFETGAQATEAVAGSGFGVSPGVAFFLGGLLVLTLVVGWWGYRNYA